MLRKKSLDSQEYIIREARIPDARGIIECMQSVMDERVFLVSEYYLLTERGEQDRLRNIEDLTLVLDYMLLWIYLFFFFFLNVYLYRYI